jgi:hypothetical protein
MIGRMGLPELIVIACAALTFSVLPLLFFGLGYYFGRRSALRSAGVPPTDPAAPTHV